MAGKGSPNDKSSASLSPKKVNLNDPHAIKHLLDETASEVVFSRGYVENVTLSNVKMVIGIIIIGIALAAQFYPKKFPENKNFLIACIILYVIFNCLLQFIIYTKEKNTILLTHPPSGSFASTGLAISSKLPRCSDMYTLCIASSDPSSISANPSVELTKSVTKWFTKDGVLVEGLFWKDVEKLIDDYTNESQKSK
uniref:Signal peptidase complex subunit 2 n=1 Tax=Araucaria cunninghamii TaxID=56994 RepID=A0A0D6R119_ARACU